MNTTRIARLAAAVVAVAGLSIVAGPTPQAAACRPVASSPTGIAFCQSLYENRGTKVRKCNRGKVSKNASWKAYPRVPKCHRRIK